MVQTRTSSARDQARQLEDATAWSRDRIVEATRTAEEAIGRSTRTAFDTFASFAETGQRMTRELSTLTVDGAKELIRLSAEMNVSALETLQAAFVPMATGQPGLDAWQRFLDAWPRILDTNAEAYSRFAGTLQSSAEEGAERMKEAVDGLTDRVKEGADQLARTAADGPERRRNNARSTTR